MSVLGSRFRRIVVYPLWRGLTAFPLSLAGLMTAPFGLARFPAAAQRRMAQRFGEVEPDSTRLRNGRAAGFALAAFLPSLLAFVIAGVWLMMLFTGYLYPVRPGAVEYISQPLTPQEGLEGAWGGNTVIAAWIGHSVIAFPLHVLGLILLYFGHCRGHDALVRRLLRPLRHTSSRGPMCHPRCCAYR